MSKRTGGSEYARWRATYFLCTIVPLLIIILFFKIHFDSKKIIYEISAINIWSFFGSFLYFESSTEWDHLWQFLLLIFAKLEKHDVPPNHRIEKCCKWLDTCSGTVNWPGARSSWVFPNFCIFPSLVISLNFGISEK